MTREITRVGIGYDGHRLVSGGKVSTPDLACGARNGVVREWVLNQVDARQGSLFVEDVER